MSSKGTANLDITCKNEFASLDSLSKTVSTIHTQQVIKNWHAPKQAGHLSVRGRLSLFQHRDVKPMLMAMAKRFPTGELVFDAMARFVAWLHKSSSVLKRSGAQIYWDAKNPAELENWGLHLLERWGYFDKPEPRMGSAANLLRHIPPLASTAYVQHYRFGK